MREECNNFNTCSAPICPLCDKEENEYYTWFQDEEICTKNNTPTWVKRQKKISRKAKDNLTYFTFEMLNRNCVIKDGIVGLDPDSPEDPQLKKWLKLHPIKRELSEEERKEIGERLNKSARSKK
jgi:hypothetical protein